MKRDPERFPRAQLRNGAGTERLTPLSTANRDADARAFAALMRRIREIDGDDHTVIMVQVENEIGMIPDARDYSPAANAAYAQSVPTELMDYLQRRKDDLDPDLRAKWRAAGFKLAGNWEAVFGPGPETEDLFMAWHYARYIGKVAEAGKFKKWSDKYDRPGNPVFIPEANYGSDGAANAFYAIGQRDALGFSPFAIDATGAASPENN